MSIHELTFPDTESEAYAKARYHFMLQIIFGETISIYYCQEMSRFSPNKDASLFLLQQQKEEESHLEMLTDYVGTHTRPHVPVSFFLKRLDYLMRDAIQRRDYIDSVFIQNFIVEGLNISLLKELEHHTDVQLSELSTKILRDEIKHMEFGVEEIKRILLENHNPFLIKKLIQLQRKSLFYAIGLAATLTYDAKNLGIPMIEFTQKVLDEHMEHISTARLPLPYFDSLFFRCMAFILKLF